MAQKKIGNTDIMNKNADNIISRAFEGYKSIVPNPLTSAIIAGAGAYGISRLAWKPIVNTIKSVARVPGKALGGMTDEEWDDAMEELKNNSSYRRWIPAAIGALAFGGHTFASYTPTERYGGLLHWNGTPSGYSNPKQKYVHPNTTRQFTNSAQQVFNPNAKRIASLQKQADLYSYDGYVPEFDFSKPVNFRHAQALFTNDPFLQNEQYVKNMGTAIVANAAQRAGTNNPTLGSVFDSAVDKIDKKLTFEGLTSIGVKSVISNSAARLFTGVLGTMMDLSPEARRNLVDAGTWAGTITAILD